MFFKDAKIDFTDYDGGLTDEMIEYCKQDVRLLKKVYEHLTSKFKKWKKPSVPLEIEHKVAIIMQEQKETGFLLDIPYASTLLGTLQCRMAQIEGTLQAIFQPIVTERWSEKTGKRLKDDVEVFNVGSRQQIAKRLTTLGAKFKTVTEKGNPIVDESTLAEIELEEAKLCSEYLMLQKREGMVTSWLDKVGDDGRVHGSVITNGAVTGRMTHSNPNMGQITSSNSVYGKESRECWVVPKGYKLVGCDLSGIELRCLAHYMQDEEWTTELLEGDIHTKNQLAAGLPERSMAKTMIYATLYGAGVAKIGNIVGEGKNRGKEILDSFYANTPSLVALKKKIERVAETGVIPALDGRALQIRSTHSALNTLLQGAGAVVAKQWLICIDENLEEAELKQYARQVVMVHDEVQFEVKEEYAEEVAKILVKSAIQAGELLNFRLPVDAEYAIGNNWYETH
jgi:DNA polymerase I-like protein with 3'-5' exonuclease and polymerase domains